MANRNNTARKPVETANEANDTDQPNKLVMERGDVSTAKMRPAMTIRQAVKTERDQRIAAKLTMFQAARQQLAEAADLYGEGEAKANEANGIANKGGLSLYQARTKGGATVDDVNAVLVDIFGAKAKADGTPGKTPDGKGNTLRQRIVRAVAAYDYLNGTDDQRRENSFFPLGIEDVTVITETDSYTLEEVINGMEQGDIPLFTAYDKFAKLKNEMKTPMPLAFDAKRLGKIYEELSGDGADDTIRNSSELRTMYAALADIIDIILDAPADAVAAAPAEAQAA